MLRMKTAFATLLLVAIAGVTQSAQATDKATIKLAVAGSSALWQVMGLATYNNTHCPSGAVTPCFHWTGTLSLTDKRPQTFGGGTAAVDSGGTWIVWDSKTTTTGTVVNHMPNVWVFTKVDSAVGDRCYFAHPRCFIGGTVSGAGGGQISAGLWGADTDPATTVDGPTVAAAFAAATGVVI